MLIIKGIDRSDAEYVRQIQSKSNKVTEEFYYPKIRNYHPIHD